MPKTLLAKLLHLFDSQVIFTDILIHQGKPLMLRQPAGIVNLIEAPITKEELTDFFEIIDPNWMTRIEDRAFGDCVDLRGTRIRINCFSFQGRRKLGCVIRAFPAEPLELNKLGLRPCELDFANSIHGLVLVIGDSGHGKSTTIASMVDHINRTRFGQILTLEDPVETLIPRRKCIITQREVGVDVENYYLGALDASRNVSDVIVIGEIRDAQAAIETLDLAGSGPLVFASLNARSTEAGLQKMLRLLGNDRRHSQSLARSLNGILCQSLVPSRKGERFYLASESLFVTRSVARMIESNNISGIRSLMDSEEGKSKPDGHSMNAALFLLLRDKKITVAAAKSATTDSVGFELNLLTLATSAKEDKVSDGALPFPYFYHMTHKDNLAAILRLGILSHSDVLVRNDIFPRDISDPGAQRWRDAQEPVYHRKIHDYAPLYINPKNPMLFVRRGMQEQIVILKISTAVLQEGQHVFSDGNAASRDTKFAITPNILVDSLDALTAEYWTNCIDGKRRRCAELLVFPNVRPIHILSIICSNNVLAKMISMETDLKIEVDASMFF